MRTLKIMSIVGLSISGISFVCLVAYDNVVDYESAIGWGIITVGYLIALSIVTLIKSLKELKKNDTN